MKRHGNLWEKLISEENIRQGILNACNNTGSKTATKRRNMRKTKERIDETVIKVQAMLKNGTFRTSHYYIYPLFDPKLRFIYCLPFYPDRLVHHCLLNVLEPIWDKLMYTSSYACRKGYGQHMAGTKCGEYARKYKYCCQFDVSQFYININHDILKTVVRRKIKDRKLLALIDTIIDSIATRDVNLELLHRMRSDGSTCPDVPREIQKLTTAKELDGSTAGLPIGNYTSQWLGNVYLNELDTFIKQKLRIKPYIRYCDDFLVFGNDKAELHERAEEIRSFLWESLHLILSKREVFPTSQGVDFVGYRYFHNGVVLLRKRTAKKQRRLLRKIRASIENRLPMDYERARGQLGSMNGLLKWAQTYHFRKACGYEEIAKEVTDLAQIQ